MWDAGEGNTCTYIIHVQYVQHRSCQIHQYYPIANKTRPSPLQTLTRSSHTLSSHTGWRAAQRAALHTTPPPPPPPCPPLIPPLMLCTLCYALNRLGSDDCEALVRAIRDVVQQQYKAVHHVVDQASKAFCTAVARIPNMPVCHDGLHAARVLGTLSTRGLLHARAGDVAVGLAEDTRWVGCCLGGKRGGVDDDMGVVAAVAARCCALARGVYGRDSSSGGSRSRGENNKGSITTCVGVGGTTGEEKGSSTKHITPATTTTTTTTSSTGMEPLLTAIGEGADHDDNDNDTAAAAANDDDKEEEEEEDEEEDVHGGVHELTQQWAGVQAEVMEAALGIVMYTGHALRLTWGDGTIDPHTSNPHTSATSGIGCDGGGNIDGVDDDGCGMKLTGAVPVLSMHWQEGLAGVLLNGGGGGGVLAAMKGVGMDDDQGVCWTRWCWCVLEGVVWVGIACMVIRTQRNSNTQNTHRIHTKKLEHTHIYKNTHKHPPSNTHTQWSTTQQPYCLTTPPLCPYNKHV